MTDPTSADIETGAVGARLVRTADGAILALTSGVTVLASNDGWQDMPVGSKLVVNVASPSLAMTLTVPNEPLSAPEQPVDDVTTTTGLTSVSEILADLASWVSDFRS